MKYLIVLLLLLNKMLCAQECPTTADYVDPIPFPGNITLAAGDTLLITQDYNTAWTSIAVTGGKIIICDNATFQVNGSLSVTGTGAIQLLGCEAKLDVFGTYNGGWNSYELEVWFCDCDVATDPFTLIWGTKVWNDWICVQPLPTELVSFDGRIIGSSNEIFWVTATEINNSYFAVERSTDAIVWKVVARLDGTNTSVVQSYTIVDSDVKETMYYRLVQTDYNGDSSVSDIILLNREKINVSERYRVNVLGQIVDFSYRGIVYIVYTDGVTKKIFQY